jgi:geranylgeranyl pyrophosphate synthase
MAVLHEHALRAGAGPRAAQRWAKAAALLAGDLALGLAHHLLATAATQPVVHRRLQDLLWSTLTTTIHGELGDVTLQYGPADADDDVVAAVGAGKTAMYTFRAPAVAAGLLASVDERTIQALDRSGHLLGRAFQLADDLRGALAPASVTGKPAGSDLRSGKRTTLVAEAREAAGWSAVAPLWSRADLDFVDLEPLRDFLVDSGAAGRTARIATELLGEASSTAAVLPAAAAAVVRRVADGIHELLAPYGSRPSIRSVEDALSTAGPS